MTMNVPSKYLAVIGFLIWVLTLVWCLVGCFGLLIMGSIVLYIVSHGADPLSSQVQTLRMFYQMAWTGGLASVALYLVYMLGRDDEAKNIDP